MTANSNQLKLVAGTCVALLAAIGIAWWAANRNHKGQVEAPSDPPSQMAQTPEAPVTPPVQIAETPVPQTPAINPVPAPPANNPPRRRGNARQPNAAPAANDPVAVGRDALAGVGADPAAEVVWTQTINDTTIAAGDRRNLIEDLNEAGFADPRNLTAADLPLIQARISLIERLSPDAADQTNSAAFREAYKDLLDMRARLTGQ